MLYALNVWFNPIYNEDTDIVNRGSIGTSRRLARVQRQAALFITGAFQTSATDVTEAHAKLLPIAQCAQTLCHRAALRIAAHPQSHPLHPLIRRAAKRYVKRHRSSLHHLTHAFRLKPSTIETIQPMRCDPSSQTPFRTVIPDSKEDSIREHNRITTGTKVYTDGSGFEGGIGASAILIRPNHKPRKTRYHLGTDKEHTIFEAGAVGLMMAAYMLYAERDIELPIHIFIDNQAAIKSGDSLFSKPSHYLIDRLLRLIRAVKKKHSCTTEDIMVQWVTGHKDIQGNMLADKEAKRAATDLHSTSSIMRLPPYLRESSLPLSVSALLQ